MGRGVRKGTNRDQRLENAAGMERAGARYVETAAASLNFEASDCKVDSQYLRC